VGLGMGHEWLGPCGPCQRVVRRMKIEMAITTTTTGNEFPHSFLTLPPLSPRRPPRGRIVNGSAERDVAGLEGEAELRVLKRNGRGEIERRAGRTTRPREIEGGTMSATTSTVKGACAP
jgi:hypothetical protein